MSRTRKAGLSALFGYAQYGLAFASGIVMVPFVLAHIGTQKYGLWLACGDLLAYCALSDFGVLAVLPWLIAENDGRNDRDAIRRLLVNALTLALGFSALFASGALLLWPFGERILHLSIEQKHLLIGPLLLLLAGAAAGMPLRIFLIVLGGLQDVRFIGWLSMSQTTLSIGLTVGLLLGGYGLYALAAAAAMPPILTALVSFLRLRTIAPDLLSGWGRPSLRQIRYMLGQGLGPWMAGFGWRMIVATSSLVLVSVSGPAAAVIYTCTSKLGDVLMPMAWQLPDSGLIGLAQLRGEGNQRRLQEVILTLLRLTLLTSGLVTFVYLLATPTFVPLWVGPEKFGGFPLVVLLASNYLAHSLIHGLIVPTATIGNRMRTGIITLAQGICDLIAAILLGRYFGILGVAASSLFSTALIALPLSLRALADVTQLTPGAIWRQALLPACRLLPVLALAAFAGVWIAQTSFWLLPIVSALLGALLLWWLRPLYEGLPVPARVRPWLVRVRLIPAT